MFTLGRFNVAAFGGTVQYWQTDLAMATTDILVSLGNWLSSVRCCGNTRLLEAIQVSPARGSWYTWRASPPPPTPHRSLWTTSPHALCMWCQMVGWTTVKSSSSDASAPCRPQLCTRLPSTAWTRECGPRVLWECV